MIASGEQTFARYTNRKRRVSRPGDRDHVEADAGGWVVGGGEPGRRQGAQAGLLARGDGGGGSAVGVAPPRLDLAEDDQAGCGRDQVDLAVAATPVVCHHHQTGRGEVVAGERFGAAAEPVPRVGGG
jgi:hypothetical protein